LHPKLIVCDEPVSALDVSIQAQILNLLVDVKKEFDLTYVFIAHDLSVVRHVSDRVAVMYLGEVVELAEVDDLYGTARHPYTAALLAAAPVPDPDFADGREHIVLIGDLPSPIHPPSGCRFSSRCPKRQEDCAALSPTLEARLGDDRSHLSACLHPLIDGETLSADRDDTVVDQVSGESRSL
jgi:oligopeptide/dipeptide ABC transporter ATP-binding protein